MNVIVERYHVYSSVAKLIFFATKQLLLVMKCGRSICFQNYRSFLSWMVAVCDDILIQEIWLWMQIDCLSQTRFSWNLCHVIIQKIINKVSKDLWRNSAFPIFLSFTGVYTRRLRKRNIKLLMFSWTLPNLFHDHLQIDSERDWKL